MNENTNKVVSCPLCRCRLCLRHLPQFNEDLDEGFAPRLLGLAGRRRVVMQPGVRAATVQRVVDFCNHACASAFYPCPGAGAGRCAVCARGAPGPARVSAADAQRDAYGLPAIEDYEALVLPERAGPLPMNWVGNDMFWSNSWMADLLALVEARTEGILALQLGET